MVGSSWLSTWLPFLQSENESRSPLLRQLGRLILVPIPPLVCTRIRHLYTSTGLLSTQERQSCIYRVGKPRDDCRTLAPARAAAPIKTPLSRSSLVVSSCSLRSLSLSSSRPSSPRGNGEERAERKILRLSFSPSRRNRARSTFRRLTEQKTIDRTRERTVEGFLLPSKLAFSTLSSSRSIIVLTLSLSFSLFLLLLLHRSSLIVLRRASSLAVLGNRGGHQCATVLHVQRTACGSKRREARSSIVSAARIRARSRLQRVQITENWSAF